MSITEAFERYDSVLKAQGMSIKTRKNYKTALSSFLKCNGDTPVELVTYDAITRWQIYMQQRGGQPSSIKSNLTRVRQVFKYLRLQGVQVIDSRDIALPKVTVKPPVWLDYSEIQQLLDVIESPRDLAIVACLFATGARVSELLSLNRDDIKDGSATVIGKGDKVGVLYFDATSLRYLDEYLETRKDNLRPLFVSGQYRRITVSRIEQLLHIYSDAAGLDKNVTPHVLRHSFASDLILNGADIYATSRLLRHQNITTTQIYTHVKEEQNQSAYAKFHSRG